MFLGPFSWLDSQHVVHPKLFWRHKIMPWRAVLRVWPPVPQLPLPSHQPFPLHPLHTVSPRTKPPPPPPACAPTCQSPHLSCSTHGSSIKLKLTSANESKLLVKATTGQFLKEFRPTIVGYNSDHLQVSSGAELLVRFTQVFDWLPVFGTQYIVKKTTLS